MLSVKYGVFDVKLFSVKVELSPIIMVASLVTVSES